MNVSFLQRKKGFTLIEIVTVLILLGIIGAISVAKIVDSHAELISQIDVIKSHLRYAQSRAMASETVWGIKSTGSEYFMFMNNDPTDKVILPGESSVDVVLSEKKVASMSKFTITFDAFGAPYWEGTKMTGSNDKSITVGSIVNAINISAVTGYIP